MVTTIMKKEEKDFEEGGLNFVVNTICFMRLLKNTIMIACGAVHVVAADKLTRHRSKGNEIVHSSIAIIYADTNGD